MMYNQEPVSEPEVVNPLQNNTDETEVTNPESTQEEINRGDKTRRGPFVQY